MSDEHAVPFGIDDYHIATILVGERHRTIGIFSNVVDAHARCVSYAKQNPGTDTSSLFVVKMPFDVMVEFLIKERLGSLHEAVMKCVDVVSMVVELDKSING